MGREARARKTRKCKVCNQVSLEAAEELMEHAQLCLRARALNIQLPGRVVVDRVVIKKFGG